MPLDGNCRSLRRSKIPLMSAVRRREPRLVAEKPFQSGV